jgi:small-conductance mechanosensitive channel
MPVDVLDLTTQAWGYVPQTVSALLIFLAFWVAGMIAQRILTRFATRIDPQRQQVLGLLGQVAKSTLLVIGFITALGTLGIDISALVAGLGLTGFALGFAFRDALSNLLAGVLILLYRPFEVGDRIR